MPVEIAEYINNPKLETFKEGWKGNPITANNRFLHHEFPYIPKISKILEWKLKGKTDVSPGEKKKDNFRLTPVFPKKYFESNDDGIVWLGHASFLIRIGGITLLIDPVITSPTFLMKRYVDFPFDASLLTKIDLLLLSHDHRDHLDKSSVKLICKNNPDLQILTSLGIESLVSQWVDNPIQEAGWFQRYNIQNKNIKISYLPSRHWGRRNLRDTNRRLWGAFMIESGGKKIYFGGDSGYGPHFKEVHQLFGQVDYAILGIGAYKPEWFMRESHKSPKDAYQAAIDMESKHMIPMHYGTFDLSDESIGDPIRSLRRYHKELKGNIELHDQAPGQFLQI